MWIVRVVAVSVPLVSGALVSCHPRLMPLPPALSAAPPPELAVPPPRTDTNLLARKVLFDSLERTDVKISPDGRLVGWLQSTPGAVHATRLWVGPATDVTKAEPLPQGRAGRVRAWWWGFESDRIVYLQGHETDDAEHLYTVDLAKRETKDLTPVVRPAPAPPPAPKAAPAPVASSSAPQALAPAASASAAAASLAPDASAPSPTASAAPARSSAPATSAAPVATTAAAAPPAPSAPAGTSAPPPGTVQARLVALSSKRPREALVALNDRDERFRDVYLVDLVTGARKLVQTNDGGILSWTADDDLRVRFGARPGADVSVEIVQAATPAKDSKDKWKVFESIPMDDAPSTRIVTFDKSGTTLLLEDSRSRDTAALVALDTKTGAGHVVSEDARADAGDVLVHPTTKVIEAVSYAYDRSAWTVVDSSVEADFYYLQTFGDGTLAVTSRSLDEQHWLVSYAHPDGPTHFYRYDRDPDIPGNVGKATFLFSGSDDLEHARLSASQPVVFKARDGLDLVGYLTLPSAEDPRSEGRPAHPIPMVLLVHDGPWSRVTDAYSPEDQWLASRGYAVLNVNYRGSSGLGKRFLTAGNLEWGGKMQDDLVDAVTWAVSEKIADPARVAIVGAGYGGYAALLGLASTPDTYACGVDAGGPSNLVTYVLGAGPNGQPSTEELARRIGDLRSDAGKELLDQRSPVTRPGAIKKPLLVEQGKNDPQVAAADTQQYIDALTAKKVPVTYVVYPDERHGFDRPANRASFRATTEVFLAQCLGGPYQPIGEDFDGASITVPAGAAAVYGLTEALAAKK